MTKAQLAAMRTAPRGSGAPRVPSPPADLPALASCALIGASFGGYLALRAAAFEKRLAARVANGGVLEFLAPRIPNSVTREQFAELLRADPESVSAGARALAARSHEVR
jgi:hypothetical protein